MRTLQIRSKSHLNKLERCQANASAQKQKSEGDGDGVSKESAQCLVTSSAQLQEMTALAHLLPLI
jgi:hypothetical protein